MTQSKAKAYVRILTKDHVYHKSSYESFWNKASLTEPL